MAEKNPLELSDADFANLNGPPEVEAVQETDAEREARELQETEAAAAAEAAQGGDDDANNGDGGDGGDADDKAGTTDGDDDDAPPGETEAEKRARLEDDEPELDANGKPIEKQPEEKPAEKGADPVGSEAKPAGDKPADTSTAMVIPDAAGLEAFYRDLMTPFKANGKMIELKSPSEVRSLMQMGANYTRKLQDIQPHRKTLMMLENNGLLDEGKLSFLIDLDKKDPEAIKKLVKESGIDPLDLDLDNVTYRPGDHRVTDGEATFRSTMEDLIKSDPENGQATVSVIYETWDDASKEVLWKQPELMTIIHEQRENGIYDAIKAEVDRLTTIGEIPPNTPFVQAYKAVGDHLAAEATAAAAAEPKPTVEPPKVVTTRAATPKSKLDNGDKASAASTTRNSPKAAGGKTNPLAMADDDFLKQWEGRV